MQTAKFVGGIETQFENAANVGVIEVACPYYGGTREIEPDGFYSNMECEWCGRHYRTIGVI